MTDEELAQATADEAYRVWCKNPDRTGNSIALIAARLAREGWTPPERVDPDLLAAREWMKRVSAYNHAHIDNGDWDGGDTIRAYLAGCTRGREEAKGLVEAPFRLNDRVKHKGQFGDAIGSIMAMQRFDHGWECWVHVAAYGYNSIIQADNLRLVSHAPDALAAAKGERV